MSDWSRLVSEAPVLAFRDIDVGIKKPLNAEGKPSPTTVEDRQRWVELKPYALVKPGILRKLVAELFFWKDAWFEQREATGNNYVKGWNDCAKEHREWMIAMLTAIGPKHTGENHDTMYLLPLKLRSKLIAEGWALLKRGNWLNKPTPYEGEENCKLYANAFQRRLDDWSGETKRSEMLEIPIHKPNRVIVPADKRTTEDGRCVKCDSTIGNHNRCFEEGYFAYLASTWKDKDWHFHNPDDRAWLMKCCRVGTHLVLKEFKDVDSYDEAQAAVNAKQEVREAILDRFNVIAKKEPT
jgi:hypothetical protein